MKNAEKIISSIYERYNPEKLSTVPALLEKYSGHEEGLLESIFTKYNISPEERDVFMQSAGQEEAVDATSLTNVSDFTPSQSETPVVQTQSAIKNPEKLISSIYERYNPEKLSTLPVLLEKYSGHEDDLLESIFTKYNISPEERDEFIRNAGQEKAEDTTFRTYVSEPTPTASETPIVQEQTVTETPYVSHSYTPESPPVITPVALETSTPSASENQIQSSVTSHSETDAQETVINKDDSSPEPVKKKGSSKLVWILISIFIIILLGLGTVALLQYNGNINIAFLNDYIPAGVKNEVNENSLNQKKALVTNKKTGVKEKPQQTKKDSTPVAIENKTPVQPVKTNTTAQPIKNNTTAQPVKNNTAVQPVKNNPTKQVNTTSNSGKDFFIIAGSYSSMQLAEEAVKKLKSKGHEGAQVVDQNQEGHVRICFKAYATRQEAMQDLSTIQKNENPTAWIYKKK